MKRYGVNLSKRKLADLEKKSIKALGASPNVNSGATFGDADGRKIFKNPITDYKYRGMTLEVKSTTKKQFTLKLETLKKLEVQSLNDLAVLVIDFSGKRFIIIPENDFTSMIESLER